MCEELRAAIRTLIGDDNPENERFDDDQINSFINISLKKLEAAVGFAVTIADGVLSRTLTSTEFSLTLLQAQCFIAHRELNSAIRKGVKVKQDENMVDTSAGLSPYINAVTGPGGACELLKEAISDYLLNGDGSGSVAAVYGENIWSGNRNAWDDVTHNGQYSERKHFPRGLHNTQNEGDTGDFDPLRMSEG